MDQAQLSTMDPKLREAYERVMGTKTQALTQSTPATPTQSQANTNPLNAINTAPASQSNSQPILQNHTQVIPAPQATTENQHESNMTLNTPNISSPPTQPIMNPNNPEPSNTSPQTAPFMDPILADNQMHAYVASEVAGVKQSLKLIQLIYIVGGLVFFVVYALFWLKFFNIPSPF